MILNVTTIVRKLPILLGFIFVLLFTTSTKDDFIGHTAKSEVNSTKISMNIYIVEQLPLIYNWK